MSTILCGFIIFAVLGANINCVDALISGSADKNEREFGIIFLIIDALLITVAIISYVWVKYFT